MRVRVAVGEEIWPALLDALAGGPPLAPAPDPFPAGWLAMVQPEVPVPEPGAAAIVATSGSTGQPKGVVLSRSALAFSADATHARLGGPGTWTSALPTFYVAGLMTLVRAWRAGTVPRQSAPDLADLSLAPGRNYLSIVPAQLDRALEVPEVIDRLAGFDAVLVGGAASQPELLARARAAGIRTVTTYGMSETCGGCVYDGVPLDGVRVTLDNDADPDGRDGRIALAGPMAFSGYRLRTDLTAEALDGDRVLTQDRGRWVDGRLQVLGRLDDVVVTGGINVDLAAAQRVCDVVFGPAERAGVLLVALPDMRWGHRLVGLTTTSLTLDEIRDRLAGQLEAAAMPREVHRVARLPLTASGKIDRRAAATAAAARVKRG